MSMMKKKKNEKKKKKILCLIARDALLSIYRIKRKSIWGLKVVIGGISLLADVLLQGSFVVIIQGGSVGHVGGALSNYSRACL